MKIVLFFALLVVSIALAFHFNFPLTYPMSRNDLPFVSTTDKGIIYRLKFGDFSGKFKNNEKIGFYKIQIDLGYSEMNNSEKDRIIREYRNEIREIIENKISEITSGNPRNLASEELLHTVLKDEINHFLSSKSSSHEVVEFVFIPVIKIE